MIRKAKQIKLVKEGEQTVMPLEDGEWIMMDAPEDGYVIKMGGGNIGVFITQSELNTEYDLVLAEEMKDEEMRIDEENLSLAQELENDKAFINLEERESK